MNETNCNNIPFFCSCIEEIASVDCSHSGLTFIPDIPATTLKLDLSDNDIDTVPTRAFFKLSKLEILDLNNNKIHSVLSLAFYGLHNLKVLSLGYNRIHTLENNTLPSTLETLNLQANQIKRIGPNDISNLGSLKVLFLSKNGIVEISHGAFDGLGKLKFLDLDDNKLGLYSYVQLDIFDPLQNLTNLYLRRNRISRLTMHSKPLVSLRVLELSNNGCQFVDKPFAESFPSLHKLHLEGNRLGKYVSDGGGYLFRGLTDLEHIIMSRNEIRKLPELIFREQVSLQLLDISKNQISGWGPSVFKYTRNIAKLDISFNLIPVLTEDNLHDLKNLKELYIGGNPFVCNCKLLWFREWIARTVVALPDKKSYKCLGPEEWRGKPVLEFTKDKINCTIIPTIVGAVSGALIISAIFVILIYRNRWRLRLSFYLLSKRGRHFLSNVGGNARHPNYGAINDNGRQDHYDAYISCSDRDYDWVIHHLLPGIDQGRYDDKMFGGDFKLYFDPRDKDPGKI